MLDLVLLPSGKVVNDPQLFKYLEMEGAIITELHAGDVITPDDPLFEPVLSAGIAQAIYEKD